MTTSDAKAPEGVDVAAFLEAPGLTSTLRDRLQAADANGDGVISAREMIDVLQRDAGAIRDNKMMKRGLIAMGVACTLIIAANVGLTYAVVAMHKDTSVENNVIVSKGGLEPLSTATLQKTVQLADLYKAGSPSELDWLTHVTVPFGEGEAWLKIQNAYLIPGQSLRFDTAAEGVSVEVTADGVTVSGDEQAPGGRRRLMQSNATVPTAGGAVSGSGGNQGTASSPSPPAPSPPVPSPPAPSPPAPSPPAPSPPVPSPPAPSPPAPSMAGPSALPPFFMENNIIKCPNATVGDTGVVNGVTYTKRDRNGLDVLVAKGSSQWPQLSTSCTSGVVDMSQVFFNVFAGVKDLNVPINSWDTSSVTTMSQMFSFAGAFNQPLNNWDTSKVKDMSDMFFGAQSFNQPLDRWDTSSVTTMKSMFEDGTAFNQDLSGWDVDLVTDRGTCDLFSCLAGFNPISRIPSWRYRSSCGTPGCPPPSG